MPRVPRAVRERVRKDTVVEGLAGRILSRMNDLGLSRAALARRAGLSARTVEWLLDGKVMRPYPGTVVLLSRALGVTPNDLLGFEEGPLGVEQRWLATEYRRMNRRQRGELLEYLRDVGDEEEGRVRRRGLRRPEGMGDEDGVEEEEVEA